MQNRKAHTRFINQSNSKSAYRLKFLNTLKAHNFMKRNALNRPKEIPVS